MKKDKIKIIRTKKVYSGQELSLKVIDWSIGKKKIKKEVLIFSKTVSVLAITKENKIVLVKQYRFPAKKELWELPAGKLEKGERPNVGAKRELEEETGFKAKKIEKIAEFYASPGYTEEYHYIFRSAMLKKGKQHLDENEVIDNVKLFGLQEIVSMIKEGKIVDGKTIFAVALESLGYSFFKK